LNKNSIIIIYSIIDSVDVDDAFEYCFFDILKNIDLSILYVKEKNNRVSLQYLAYVVFDKFFNRYFSCIFRFIAITSILALKDFFIIGYNLEMSGIIYY